MSASARLFLFLLLGLTGVARAQQLPDTLPPTGPITPFPLPTLREELLPNGLRLVVAERPGHPVVSLVLAVPAGSAFDPEGKEGIADLYARLLLRGAGTRSAADLAIALERVGASLGAVSDPDLLTIQADVLASEAELAFGLVGDMVLRPALDTADIAATQLATVQSLEAELQNPSALGRRVFLIAAYREHAYARRPTPQSVRGITQSDLEAFRRARVRPTGSVLVVTGDITVANARRLALAALGTWRGVRGAVLPPVPIGVAPKGIILVHQGGAEAAELFVGRPTFSGADTSYYAAAVLNRILGDGPNARLPRALGNRHGWTLATGSSFLRTLRLGLFQATAEVPAEVADSALREIRNQLQQLSSELVPARELERARDGVSGAFPLGLQTASQLSAALTQSRVLGLPATYLMGYRARINAVTAAQVRALARRLVDTSQVVTVVVGDASRLYGPLSAMAPTRIFAGNGRPLTPKDVEPKTVPLTFDLTRYVPRTDSLAILVQGQAVGLQISQRARAGDSLTYRESSRVGDQLSQITLVVLDTAGHMRRVEQNGKVRGQDTRIRLVYGSGRVTGQAQVVGTEGPKAFNVDTAVSPNVVDDNALQALLPTLPWALNTRWTIPVFASGENRLRPMTLTVADITRIQVPAGVFEVFRADLEGGPQLVSFYVSTTPPHRLVRVTLAGSPIEFLALNP